MDLLVAMALVQRALSERQQVVVPLAIRISTDVRSLARLTDHADIGALPTYGIQNKNVLVLASMLSITCSASSATCCHYPGG
jgi:hypothetical protein